MVAWTVSNVPYRFDSGLKISCANAGSGGHAQYLTVDVLSVPYFSTADSSAAARPQRSGGTLSIWRFNQFSRAHASSV